MAASGIDAVYPSLIESFPDSLAYTDLSGNILIASRAAALNHGYEDARDLIGINVVSFIAPEEDRDINETIRQLLETGSMRHEHTLIRKDGTRFDAEVISSLVRDGKGLPLGIISTARSITDRKLAQSALRESEERYRRITAAITDYIYTVKIEKARVIETVHGPACEAITGYTPSEFKGDPYLWINMVHADDRDAVRHQAEQILAGTAPGPIEHRIWRKDGTLRWVRSTLVPHIDDTGSLVSYDGLITDITEKRDAEAARRESEERYRLVSQLSVDYFFKADITPEGRPNLSYVSENITAITGRRQDEVSGMNQWIDIIHPDDRSLFISFYQKVLASGRTDQLECRSFLKTGALRWINVSVYPTVDPGTGRVTSILGTVKDITERKMAVERLRASLREKEILLKEIHHRVKNNLQIITSLLSLRAQHLNNQELARHFTEAENRIRSMALVHEKLYQSEVLSDIDFSSYISELANSILSSYTTLPPAMAIDTHDRQVFLAIDQAIPAGLLITELLTNAIRHAFPPGWNGTPEIRISLQELSDGMIELCISDNGIGLPPEANTGRSTTLGLSLIPMLVSQISGTMTLDTSGGTSYAITFRRQ